MNCGKKIYFQIQDDVSIYFRLFLKMIFFYAEASMYYDKEPDEPIGIRKYNKSKITYCINKEKTTEECPICLDKLQKTFSKKYITLECGHSFHEKCFIHHADTKKNKI
jgi:hypothetical protein